MAYEDLLIKNGKTDISAMNGRVVAKVKDFGKTTWTTVYDSNYVTGDYHDKLEETIRGYKSIMLAVEKRL